ncbi:MAG: hypothetical protein JXR95_11230 [Deltaproteobacteria bacterium]|nr:hypothetical protein [Deltaproteobacteria bacterium]
MNTLGGKIYFAGILIIFLTPVAFSVTGATVLNKGSFTTLLSSQVKDNKSKVEESLSPEQMISTARQLSSTWAEKESSIVAMQAEAKKKKNIMRMNCLEPKLKSAKFWIGEGKASMKDLSGGDKERLALTYQKIRVIHGNIEEQVFEASRCVGDEKFSTGEGFKMEVQRPEYDVYNPDEPGIIVNDPLDRPNDYVPFNPDWSIEQTWPNASPYM